MKQAIKLHTQHAPKGIRMPLTERDMKDLLIRAQDEIAAGNVKLASRLVGEVIEAIRT
jgi:hypothetical protein